MFWGTADLLKSPSPCPERDLNVYEAKPHEKTDFVDSLASASSTGKQPAEPVQKLASTGVHQSGLCLIFRCPAEAD